MAQGKHFWEGVRFDYIKHSTQQLFILFTHKRWKAKSTLAVFEFRT